MFLGSGMQPCFFPERTGSVNCRRSCCIGGNGECPTAYNPRRNPKGGTRPRNLVINRMVTNNFISEKEGETAKAKPIAINFKKQDASQGIAPISAKWWLKMK
jgi:penicillin-binding protein 1A